MFWKRKAKSAPTRRSDPEPTGVYKQPVQDFAEEERTETVRLLLDTSDLALEDDTEPGSDPHDNSVRLSVKSLRDKYSRQ